MSFGIESKQKVIHTVTILRWFDPFSPIALIIGFKFGISYYEMFLLQAIFSFTNLIGELPAGIIADRYGRGLVISLSSFFLALAYFLFMIFPSFITWAIAEIFAGIGIAFYSGADTALLYESCQNNKNGFYHRQEGLMQAFARLSEGLSAGLGFIAIIDPRMPIALAFTAKIILLVICWTQLSSSITHPSTKVSTGHQSSTQISLSGFLEALRIDKQQRPKQHRVLMTTFFYAASQSIVLINIFWMIQVTANMIELSLIWTSMIWVLYFTLCGTTSYFISSTLKTHWRQQIIALPIISCILLYTSISISLAYRWIPLVMFSFIYGLSMPLINVLINQHSTQDKRVMMHSINTTLTRLLFVLIVPFIGYITDYVSPEAALMALLMIAFICFFLGIRLVKIKK